MAAGFAGQGVGRRPRGTCALWARIFEGPGSTDSGWPKKVSRRLQDATPFDLVRPGVKAGCLGAGVLAGVFVAAGLACRDGRRTSPPTCALWARIFEGPGSTDSGWPKKVSRRLQDATPFDLVRPAVNAGCLGAGVLAVVFVVAGFACRDGRRTSPPTCALWARIFKGPGSTDSGWPKKVSRRLQEPTPFDLVPPGVNAGYLGAGVLAGCSVAEGSVRRRGRRQPTRDGRNRH